MAVSEACSAVRRYAKTVATIFAGSVLNFLIAWRCCEVRLHGHWQEIEYNIHSCATRGSGNE